MPSPPMLNETLTLGPYFTASSSSCANVIYDLFQMVVLRMAKATANTTVAIAMMVMKIRTRSFWSMVADPYASEVSSSAGSSG